MIEDEIYTGTPGLWELIVRKELPKIKITDEDYLNYGKILKQTDVIYHDNNSKNNKPKSNRGDKWKKVIKPIWDNIKEEKGKEEKGKGGKGGKGKGGKGGKGKGKEKKQKEETEDEYEEFTDENYPQPKPSGKGLKFLSSDPNALIDRFDLLFSSQKAGHTGVRNEIISILDELKRQEVIKTNEYKKLNSLIKK